VTSSSQVSWVRLFIIAVISTLLGLGIYYSPAFFIKKEAPQTHLKSSGTSVAYVMMQSWRPQYRIARNVELDYASVGTSIGIDTLIEKQVPLAFLHAPMKTKERSRASEKGGDVVHIPVLVCGVVPIFNVPELQPVLEDKDGKQTNHHLVFSGQVLADIYLGKITKWNDEAIKNLQDPEVKALLPDRLIYVIHRDDSSGTTQIFTEFLSQTSSDWDKQFGAHRETKKGDEEEPSAGRSTLDWPIGVAVTRTSGMTECVRKTKYSLGYADLVNVWHDEVPGRSQHYAAVVNRKGKPLQADSENMTAAIEQALPRLTDAPGYQLTYQDGDNSYPLTGLIWAVCYQSQPDADRKMVVDFLQWVTHEGQKTAGRMAYAPLPPELVQRADQKIQSIKPL
jgi:phosphate ABC transporter phosphate-binding protein